MGSSVLVVDDHEGFRTEARAVLEGDGFEVVGEAGTAADAIAAADVLKPGVVVLDIGLPDESGLDIVGRLRSRSPGSVIVLVSGRRARDYGDRVARSGADAFLEKALLVPGTMPSLLGRLADA
jgi:two-component system, chemotaxis family, chemotaxis protein CheY